MESFTWGSQEGRDAVIESVFRCADDRFTMDLNERDCRNMLTALVLVSQTSDASEGLREWAGDFVGGMAESADVDWV